MHCAAAAVAEADEAKKQPEEQKGWFELKVSWRDSCEHMLCTFVAVLVC